MEFKWVYEEDEPLKLSRYLKRLGLTRRFINQVKFNGGKLIVNGTEEKVNYILEQGDELVVIAPAETTSNTKPTYEKLDIIYEDRDLLVINKPAGLLSIPNQDDTEASVASRLQGYYISQNYENQVIHIVTRLDKDTSGLMLIAKHRLAHAWLSKELEEGRLNRYYKAVSQKNNWKEEGIIDAPIARLEESLIERCVSINGQFARTSYKLVENFKKGALLKLKLYTGRTHQIRVHLSYLNGPLIGDDLYGGTLEYTLKRQALHCYKITFIHPFTKENMQFEIDLPYDIKNLIKELY